MYLIYIQIFSQSWFVVAALWDEWVGLPATSCCLHKFLEPIFYLAKVVSEVPGNGNTRRHWWSGFPVPKTSLTVRCSIPTRSERVLPVPLSRKPFRVLVSSLGRDRSPVYVRRTASLNLHYINSLSNSYHCTRKIPPSFVFYRFSINEGRNEMYP